MLIRVFFATFLLSACAAAAAGQASPERSVVNAREEFFNIRARSAEIERMKIDAAKRPDRAEITRAFPQIKEDFERIQRLDIAVVTLAADKSPLRIGELQRYAAEINRRAERLRSNLFSTSVRANDGSEENRQASAPGEIKALVAALDRSIGRFVNSPIFRNVKVVDLADSQKAQTQLDKVIEASEALKATIKFAGRSSTAGKP